MSPFIFLIIVLSNFVSALFTTFILRKMGKIAKILCRKL